MKLLAYLVQNGAGKTTTFYMVVGLVRHDQGKKSPLDGDDTRVLPMHERARRGIRLHLPKKPLFSAV